MPTYEYACDGCKHEFEEFQSITADPLTKCPKCGRKKLRRLIGTGGGIIFKGAGFYQTDYRSESYKSAAESDKKSSTGGSEPEKSSGDASVAKTESKSTTTPPAAPKPDKKTKSE